MSARSRCLGEASGENLGGSVCSGTPQDGNASCPPSFFLKPRKGPPKTDIFELPISVSVLSGLARRSPNKAGSQEVSQLAQVPGINSFCGLNYRMDQSKVQDEIIQTSCKGPTFDGLDPSYESTYPVEKKKGLAPVFWGKRGAILTC